jgi:xanthine dehydrogenase iron-sulfur cluster and FAD-binding subunit A
VEQFLEQGLQTNEVLVSILVPAAKASSASSAVVFNTYRAATRKQGNAVAYINAAFRVELETIQGAANGSKLAPPEASTINGGSVNGVEVHPPKSQSANGTVANGGEQRRAVLNGGLENGGVSTPPQVVKDIVLVFGALGEKLPIRAEKTEAALRGKELSACVLLEGLRVLEGELSMGEEDEYRLEVAAGFLYRFFAPYVDSPGKISTLLVVFVFER